MTATPTVIKISGNQLTDMAYVQQFAQAIATLRQTQPLVIVHGGGREITELQAQLAIEPHYIDGVRVTDKASLEVVVMVLCGVVNKRLVHHLNRAGVDALGLSGVDRDAVRARQMPHDNIDMGFTGAVQQVRAEVFTDLLSQEITPVLSPVCAGETNTFNVNADHVAGAVAAALNAEQLMFVSNVPGVLRDDDVLPALSADETATFIDEGIIHGGMIPKVQTALAALDDGIAQTVITDLNGLQTGRGTVFRRR